MKNKNQKIESTKESKISTKILSKELQLYSLHSNKKTYLKSFQWYNSIFRSLEFVLLLWSDSITFSFPLITEKLLSTLNWVTEYDKTLASSYKLWIFVRSNTYIKIQITATWTLWSNLSSHFSLIFVYFNENFSCSKLIVHLTTSTCNFFHIFYFDHVHCSKL